MTYFIYATFNPNYDNTWNYDNNPDTKIIIQNANHERWELRATRQNPMKKGKRLDSDVWRVIINDRWTSESGQNRAVLKI